MKGRRKNERKEERNKKKSINEYKEKLRKGEWNINK